jgi:hypothetical protein
MRVNRSDGNKWWSWRLAPLAALAAGILLLAAGPAAAQDGRRPGPPGMHEDDGPADNAARPAPPPRDRDGRGDEFGPRSRRPMGPGGPPSRGPEADGPRRSHGSMDQPLPPGPPRGRESAWDEPGPPPGQPELGMALERLERKLDAVLYRLNRLEAEMRYRPGAEGGLPWRGPDGPGARSRWPRPPRGGEGMWDRPAPPFAGPRDRGRQWDDIEPAPGPQAHRQTPPRGPESDGPREPRRPRDERRSRGDRGPRDDRGPDDHSLPPGGPRE